MGLPCMHCMSQDFHPSVQRCASTGNVVRAPRLRFVSKLAPELDYFIKLGYLIHRKEYRSKKTEPAELWFCQPILGGKLQLDSHPPLHWHSLCSKVHCAELD